MSFIQPDEAPQLHIELLPSRATAVQVECRHLVNTIYCGPSIVISVWSPGLPMPAAGEETYESFSDNNCDDCQYYTDEVEINANHSYYQTCLDDGEEVTITGTFYVHSPCPRYNDGMESVSFPCYAGHDLDANNDHEPLSTEYMRYDHVFKDDLYFHPYDTLAMQQKIEYLTEDESENTTGYYSSDKLPAINCFDNDSICWGNNSDDASHSLLQIESIFTTSPANEDLCSFQTHADNADEIECADLEYYQPNAIGLSSANHRGKAVIIASARTMADAYILLGASGAHLYDHVAVVTALFYKNVAVDDDHILDVWATDVLPTGKRLLFIQQHDDDLELNCLFLGQVPSDFNLQPCESLPVQSLELAEPVSS